MSQPAVFPDFSAYNALIVGDVMIDRYLTGSVTRISPEAPVPVVQLERSEDRIGGAANVALNVQALGAKAYLCGVLGDDEEGQRFGQLLPEHGLSERGLLRSPARVTTVKSRLLAQNQHLLRFDREDSFDLSAAEEEALLERLRYLLDHRDIHVIILQDYNKGVLTPRLIREIILEALRRDIPTLADPKRKNFYAYRHVTLFKPNLKEVSDSVDFAVSAKSEASLRQASQHLRQQLGSPYVLITLGDKGMYLNDNDVCRLVPTRPRSISDVCGAGDTVASVAALGLAAKMPLPDIAQLANMAGGQVCEKVGVVPVDLAALRREYAGLAGR